MDIWIKGRQIKICYSRDQHTHVFGLNDRPFNAIQSGEKQVEFRTSTSQLPFDYATITPNDRIVFINEETGEELIRAIIRVTHYQSSRELDENEGLQHSSSKPATIDEAIERLESLTDYKASIAKHGVWAIQFQGNP